MPNALQLATERAIARESVVGILPDSGTGGVYRNTLTGPEGGRVTTLETYYAFWLDWVTDPDASMAQNPNWLEVGMMNPYVRAALNKRSKTLATFPVRFQPSDAAGINRELAQTIADYCDGAWKKLPNKAQMYQSLVQNAVWGGGQGVEFTWGNYNGKLIPRQWFPVSKTRIVFDRKGNLSLLDRRSPVWGDYIMQAPTAITKLNNNAWATPPGKFVYHTYDKGQGTWQMPLSEGYFYYGRGEASYLWPTINYDFYAVGYWMKWLETFAQPTKVMSYPMNDPQFQKYAQTALQQIKNGNVITLPSSPQAAANGIQQFMLEFKEATSMGFDAYFNFSTQYVQPRVNEILLGGAESMSTGEKGSYGAQVEQKSAGENVYFAYDAIQIDDTITNQLIPHMVQNGFPGCPEEYYPRHCITPEKSRDRMAEMELLKAGAELVPIREEDVYDTLGKKKPKIDIATGQQEPSVFMGQAANGMMDPLMQADPLAEDEPGEEMGGGAEPKKPMGSTVKPPEKPKKPSM